jgi:hypothetical protein
MVEQEIRHEPFEYKHEHGFHCMRQSQMLSYQRSWWFAI